jgi:hypothetical protein
VEASEEMPWVRHQGDLLLFAQGVLDRIERTLERGWVFAWKELKNVALEVNQLKQESSASHDLKPIQSINRPRLVWP